MYFDLKLRFPHSQAIGQRGLRNTNNIFNTFFCTYINCNKAICTIIPSPNHHRSKTQRQQRAKQVNSNIENKRKFSEGIVFATEGHTDNNTTP